MKSKIFSFLAVCYIAFALILASPITVDKPYQQGWLPPEQLDTTTLDNAHIKVLEPNCMVLWIAKWCPSCKKMEPAVKQLTEMGYAVHVKEYDEDRKKAKKLKIRVLPTVIIYTNGIEVSRHIGVVAKEKILKTLKKNKIDYELY